MQFLKPTLRKRLAYSTYAVALVCSLSVYQSVVVPKPLSVAQQHWGAIASEDPNSTVTQYSQNAILLWSDGVWNQVYQGESIYPVWKKFFSHYQIQDFQVVKQQQQDLAIEAKITITAKSNQGNLVVLSIAHKVQFDETGKIIHEVWQTNADLNV